MAGINSRRINTVPHRAERSFLSERTIKLEHPKHNPISTIAKGEVQLAAEDKNICKKLGSDMGKTASSIPHNVLRMVGEKICLKPYVSFSSDSSPIPNVFAAIVNGSPKITKGR